MYVSSSGSVTLEDCVVSGNTQSYSTTSSYYGGGGIYVDSNATLTLTGGEVSQNVAGAVGGGIRTSGTVVATGASLTVNASRSGGGIYSSSGQTQLTDSMVSGTRASPTAAGCIRTAAH
jgi:hypothetical protein